MKCYACEEPLTLPPPSRRVVRVMEGADQEPVKRVRVTCPKCGKENIVEVKK